MKNLVSITLCIMILCSCTKSNNNAATLKYTLSNIQDFSFANNQSYVWVINVGLNSGPQENVTLSLGNLPANVTVTPASTTGLPTYSATFTLNAVYATPGTYPITVIASSASTAIKTYTVNMTITSDNSCASALANIYQHSTVVNTGGASSSTGNNVPVIITAVSGNTVTMHNLTAEALSSTWDNVQATLNCDNGTFTIPKQLSNGADVDTMYGSGQVYANMVVVNFYGYYYNFHQWHTYIDTLRL